MTQPVFSVRYVCRHWVGKPDPNGWGKCAQSFYSLDEAERKAERLKAKGHGSVRIHHV